MIRHLIVTFTVLAALLFAGSGLAQPFTIGFSNGYIGNNWRTQMIEDTEQLFEQYREMGLVDELIVQNAGLSVPTQIAQIRNMINAGVDAILVDPNSATALNPVLNEAIDRGIVVVVVDQPVENERVAANVVIDQAEWARTSARWLADRLGGEGDIIMVNGLAGHPANENRVMGAKEVFSENPGINILTEVNGDWDEGVAQQVVSSLLGSYQDIDGVWVQDGMGVGTVQAFQAADRELPELTGEALVAFMNLWNDLRAEGDFTTIATLNPPGVAATGLGIAVRLLQGREFADDVLQDGNNFYIPVETVNDENFEDWYAQVQDQPDTYFLDSWLSEEELDNLFN